MNIKKLLGLLIPVLVVIFVLLKLAQFKDVWLLLKKEIFLFLFLAILTQVFVYIIISLLYSTTLKIMHYTLKLKKLIKISLAMQFLNQIMPSFGISGATLLFTILKKENISEGKSVILVILQIISYYIAFFAVLILGFVYLFFHNQLELRFIIMFLIALTLISIPLFYLRSLIKNPEKLKIKFKSFSIRICKLFKKKFIEQKFNFIIDEFYIGKDIALKNKKKFITPILLSFLKIMLDLLTIYFIFLSFGYKIHIGVLIVGLGLATLFGWLSFIPAGLGVFEVSMAAIYSGLFVPFKIAVVTTLIFRALTLWLPIPVGYLFYRNLLKK